MTPSDVDDQLLAELHAARHLILARPDARDGISHADLWGHVRRQPGQPVSLAIQRGLRDDPALARRYRAMLQALSMAHSPVALAASDGRIRRTVGDMVVELLCEPDQIPLLVISNVADPSPQAVELVGESGTALRLALPPFDGGAIIVSLVADGPDSDAALGMLQDPGTAIFLLP
ncbi:hypothetical protein [Actibacterium sp. 188UL27-1]|uniref:hypothetical protein n=1 Tax=Actibacterium sp. 188UL27-1 TaxID=2786961 RepID=UPI001957967A|nr:hypothetical protein [Actibacterium sp. 188UL27-1]MBM7067440.1 hypothetical protein [Actibacterium sp. 188UL27-1]